MQAHTLFLSNCVPDESMSIITAILQETLLLSLYANFKLAQNEFFPHQKVISFFFFFFFAPPYLSHTWTRATIRHAQTQQHVIADKLWEVVAIKICPERKWSDSRGSESQHRIVFICKSPAETKGVCMKTEYACTQVCCGGSRADKHS